MVEHLSPSRYLLLRHRHRHRLRRCPRRPLIRHLHFRPRNHPTHLPHYRYSLPPQSQIPPMALPPLQPLQPLLLPLAPACAS